MSLYNSSTGISLLHIASSHWISIEEPLSFFKWINDRHHIVILKSSSNIFFIPWSPCNSFCDSLCDSLIQRILWMKWELITSIEIEIKHIHDIKNKVFILIYEFADCYKAKPCRDKNESLVSICTPFVRRVVLSCKGLAPSSLWSLSLRHNNNIIIL